MKLFHRWVKRFKFNLTEALKEYTESNTSLHYLKPLMVDSNTEKRRTKGKYSKTSSVYTSKFLIGSLFRTEAGHGVHYQ